MLKYTEEQFGNKLFRISRNFTVFTKFYFNREKSLAHIIYNAMNIAMHTFFQQTKELCKEFLNSIQPGSGSIQTDWVLPFLVF